MIDNLAPSSGCCSETTGDAPHLNERAMLLDLGTAVLKGRGNDIRAPWQH